jgi:hypothetical protein
MSDTKFSQQPPTLSDRAEVLEAISELWLHAGHGNTNSRDAAATRMNALSAMLTVQAADNLGHKIESNTDRFMKAFTNLQRVMDERAKELTAATNASAAQAQRLGWIGIGLGIVGAVLAGVEAASASKQLGWW